MGVLGSQIEYPIGNYSYMAVNLDYICSWLRPEEFRCRRPSDTSIPVALAVGTY